MEQVLLIEPKNACTIFEYVFSEPFPFILLKFSWVEITVRVPAFSKPMAKIIFEIAKVFASEGKFLLDILKVLVWLRVKLLKLFLKRNCNVS